MMGDWNAIRLTRARQVAELMGIEEAALPDADLPARAHYDALRAHGALVEAIDFLGHALPRFEAVSWAASILDAESRARALPLRDRQALDHALRWLGDPDDATRRAAQAAAEAATDRSAERLIGLAVFFSGGSISLPDLPPVLPPPEASCRLAAGAIKIAAYRSGAPETLMAQALILGEGIAEQGIRALQPA